MMMRRGGDAADQRTGQDFAHQGEPIALMPAKGQQGAARLVPIQHTRIIGGLALGIHQSAIRHRLAGIEGNATLPKRDGRRGEIQDQRVFTFRYRRHGNADRVGGHAPIGPAKGRHRARAGNAIDEMDRNHPSPRRLFAVGTNAPQMMHVLQRHHRMAMLARGIDRPIHGDAPDALAIAHLAVKHGKRCILPHRFRHGAGIELAGTEIFHIAHQQHDAVAVMALQIRFQQMIRDHRRFIFGTTPRADHGMHQAAQGSGINAEHRGGFHGHSPG